MVCHSSESARLVGDLSSVMGVAAGLMTRASCVLADQYEQQHASLALHSASLMPASCASPFRVPLQSTKYHHRRQRHIARHACTPASPQNRSPSRAQPRLRCDVPLFTDTTSRGQPNPPSRSPALSTPCSLVPCSCIPCTIPVRCLLPAPPSCSPPAG